MSQFAEFDSYVRPVEQNKPPKSDVAEQFPAATALVAELHAMCPELFAGAKTIYMAEGGREIKTRVYRQVEGLSFLTAHQFYEIGKAVQNNEGYLARGKKSQKPKYLLIAGWVRSKHDGDRHYVSAPQLAVLYKVNFQECRVFMPGEYGMSDERALAAFKADGYVFLEPDYHGKYSLPDGVNHGR